MDGMCLVPSMSLTKGFDGKMGLGLFSLTKKETCHYRKHILKFSNNEIQTKIKCNM